MRVAGTCQKRRWYEQLEERWKTMPRTETFTRAAVFNRTSCMRLTWAFSSSVPCKCQTELTEHEVVTTVWLMLWFLYRNKLFWRMQAANFFNPMNASTL